MISYPHRICNSFSERLINHHSSRFQGLIILFSKHFFHDHVSGIVEENPRWFGTSFQLRFFTKLESLQNEGATSFPWEPPPMWCSHHNRGSGELKVKTWGPCHPFFRQNCPFLVIFFWSTKKRSHMAWLDPFFFSKGIFGNEKNMGSKFRRSESKKSPTGPTEWTPTWCVSNSSSKLPRGPLVRSHSIFDGLNYQIFASWSTIKVEKHLNLTQNLEAPHRHGPRWWHHHCSQTGLLPCQISG